MGRELTQVLLRRLSVARMCVLAELHCMDGKTCSFSLQLAALAGARVFAA